MLSRSGVHAIRAMVFLASQQPGAYCGTSAIAAATGAPRNYLGKLLLLLSRRSLVDSQKGLGGGFRLSRSPDQISLREVIESIEDVAWWKACAFGGRPCSDETPCAIHDRWGRVRDTYLSFLENTSVAEVAASRALAGMGGPGLAAEEPLVPFDASRRPQ